MALVLDTSITMAWCFEDETTAFTDYLLELVAGDGATVPAIWPLEVANALLTAERRRRLLAADSGRFTELLGGLPIQIESATLERCLGAVLQTARDQGLSSYDATYLELAMREGLPLATSDERLAAAARRLGVPLVE